MKRAAPEIALVAVTTAAHLKKRFSVVVSIRLLILILIFMSSFRDFTGSLQTEKGKKRNPKSIGDEHAC